VAEIVNVGRGKIVSTYAMKAFGNTEEYFYQPLVPAILGGKRRASRLDRFTLPSGKTSLLPIK